MDLKRMYWSLPLLAASMAATAKAQLSIAPTAPVLLRSGAGVSRFTLTNHGSAAVALDLKAGPVLDATSGVKLGPPKIVFLTEAGETPTPAQIAPGQSLQLEAAVTGLTGAVISQTKLFNGTTPLADLNAIALDDPITVTVEGEGRTDDRPLTSVYKQPTTITLKNGSSEFLDLGWTLKLDTHEEGHGTIKLSPSGTGQIAFNPPLPAYAPTDFLRPSTHVAQLFLRAEGPDDISKDLLPAKVLPVNLLLAGSTSTWTSVASYIFVSICLIFGGFLSILASSVLPNMMRKINLRRQVSELADRTSSVSTRVDSYLRVLLRLERKKIDVALAEIRPLSLTAVDQLADCAVAIVRIQKRLVVAERLDELRRRFEDASATAPPSITECIDKALAMASGQLHSFVLPDEDVDAANDFLDKAEDLIKLLDDNDGQAKLIAANFVLLKARVLAFPPGYITDLRAALPGIFQILENPFEEPKNIYPPMFFAIDHGIAAMQTALNYAMVRATIPAGKSESCDTAGQGALKRLKEHECELLNLLGTLSWKPLRAAMTLVQQMREDIYEADVLDQIEKKRAKIVFDTQRARPYLPVYFSICFDDVRFNGAAALNWLSLTWTFPNELTETGWKVCHYFQGDEPNIKTPPPTHSEGKSAPVVKPAKSGRVLIEASAQSPRLDRASLFSAEIEVQPSKPRREYSAAIAGGLRFAIAFGVALAGLESGAVDQLAKLGFFQATLAIIALGFGADAVKNLLTQSSKPEPAPKPAK